MKKDCESMAKKWNVQVPVAECPYFLLFYFIFVLIVDSIFKGFFFFWEIPWESIILIGLDIQNFFEAFFFIYVNV